MRQIEITFPEIHTTRVTAILSTSAAEHWRLESGTESGQRTAHALVDSGKGQPLIDQLQAFLKGHRGWHISILPVEATLPTKNMRPPTTDNNNKPKQPEKKPGAQLREELHLDIKKGAIMTRQFLVLTFLSTIVAAIGLNTDNISAVIGAMVIAPLLGPNLALTFAATVGDQSLLLKSLKTNGTGVLFSIAISFAIGALFGANMDSHELMSRTSIGMDSIALALVSGAAASLSLATGMSSALVGVMVAVALLPPATAIGLFLGSGDWQLAQQAATLLLINVVCVNLAAQIVFFAEGVRPPPWHIGSKVNRSFVILIVFWTALLAGLTFTLFSS